MPDALKLHRHMKKSKNPNSRKLQKYEKVNGAFRCLKWNHYFSKRSNVLCLLNTCKVRKQIYFSCSVCDKTLQYERKYKRHN